jgi:hypothetical protein
MVGPIFATVIVVFLGLTFLAWRQYLSVARDPRRQEDTARRRRPGCPGRIFTPQRSG